jgi:alginate O-acetyltransferase complex protein AlgI
MLFNELAFLIFFPVVAALHFAIPQRYRWLLLLLASYVFYMWWRVEYAALIIISTCIDYFAAIRMGSLPHKSQKKKYLLLSLASNLGLLFSFKYFNFFNDSLSHLFSWFGNPLTIPDLDVLLPVGISFYTFQTLSYTIEVYRGKMEPERHFGKFALYVSFFPQLVAGPIERAKHLLPQIDREKRVDYNNFAEGFFLILWGMFKKIVIADRLAVGVDAIYSNPEAFPGPVLVLATLLFAWQIYYDFSGYSDIAIGAARMLGYDLMYNFHSPYFAKSIGEFWSRWHISLSSWFRDYLYIPLGGNRVKQRRWLFNIMIVFTVSGLWHGANWTFIVWGALHGSYYLVQAAWNRMAGGLRKSALFTALPGLYDTFCLFVTFAAVNFAWIFFRAGSLGDAMTIVGNLGTGWGQALHAPQLRAYLGSLRMGNANLAVAVASIVLITANEWFYGKVDLEKGVRNYPVYVRWSLYVVLALAILHLGIMKKEPFIYFAF